MTLVPTDVIHRTTLLLITFQSIQERSNFGNYWRNTPHLFDINDISRKPQWWLQMLYSGYIEGSYFVVISKELLKTVSSCYSIICLAKGGRGEASVTPYAEKINTWQVEKHVKIVNEPVWFQMSAESMYPIP